MTAITQALSSALLHFVWQGIVVACLLWIALFMLRKRSPTARYLVSVGALITLMAMPMITMYLAYTSSSSVAVVAGGPTAVVPAVIPHSVLPLNVWPAWVEWWTLNAWFCGVLLFSTRVLWGYKQVYTLKRCGEPADPSLLEVVQNLARRMAIGRPIKVLMSSMADGPSVVGWLRPVILLPAASVVGLTCEQLEAVIAHELAHIRRHDYFVSGLQAVVETLLFYHPAVWWTSGRIRHERELCCDDLAVSACGDALCYARALTKLEKGRIMKPSVVLGSTDGSLLYRIQRLVGVKTQEHVPSKLSVLLVFFLVIAGVVVNLNWARAESPGPQEMRAVAQVRDRSGVSVNLGASSVLHRTSVEYPKAAVVKGIQGTLAVEATVDSNGNVVDARVLSGPLELRRPALQSVFDRHFAPGGPSTQVVHITFDPAAAQAEPQERRGVITVAAELERKKAAAEKEAMVLKAKELKLAGSDRHVVFAHDELEARNLKKKLEAGEIYDRAAVEEKIEAVLRIEESTRAWIVMDQPLNSIKVVGLTEPLHQQLMSRLPVRQGEILTRRLVEAITAAVHQFDEHLRVRFVPMESGGAELQIVAPGGK